MDWYYYIAITAISLQLLFLILALRNYRYALNKYKRERRNFRPRTALFIPCKGLDSDFQKNITSFFNLDYDNYLLWFVVEDQSDPAYSQLCSLKEQLSKTSKASDIQVLVAGRGKSCSQKIHNLLYCYQRISDDVEVLAFADSDVCARQDWLKHLVHPLKQPKRGAAGGYRWFIPKRNNLASLALSAINAKVAQLLGNTLFNQTWGGSMAIRTEVFRKVGLEKIWQKTLSDDLSLSNAVRKAGLKVAFVPACLVASHQSFSWPQLFEFGRRQFLITRVNRSRTWWFGFLGTFFSVLGLWGGAVLANYAAAIADKNLSLYIAVPIIFFVSPLIRAILRQDMVSKLFKENLPKMKFAMAADILFFWLWSLILLAIIISSAFGRTITWRNIRYKLISPTETIILNRKD